MNTTSSSARCKLVIIGSGKGSNFVSIAEAIVEGRIRAEIMLVLSDNAEAGILERARERGIAAEAFETGPYRTRLSPEAEEALAARIQEVDADFVILAGYMRMVKTPLLNAFPGRIINIHPSLLPAFPGLEAWRQALEAGVETTGCTVHYVDEGMDTGPIIAQSIVPILRDDTVESIHARIQAAEHRLYPEVVALLTETWEKRR